MRKFVSFARRFVLCLCFAVYDAAGLDATSI